MSRLGPEPIRIAIVGCGAIAEQSCLPALSRLPSFRVVSLVDVDLDRARRLAEQYRVGHCADTVDELGGLADAAVVAVPHALHRPVACQLMSKGLHVFCEKPMATTAAEAEAMVAAAAEAGVQLNVGQIRRFFWSSVRVKEMLAAGELGPLQAFHIEEGYVHNWPTTSGFFFDRAQSGGGVLMDMGAHVLDLLVWWLGADATLVRYQDDDLGGMDAECDLELRFDRSVAGRVKLSRLRRLRNHTRLEFADGAVTLQPYDPSGICHAVVVSRKGKETLLKAPRVRTYTDHYREQLMAFAASVRSGIPSPLAAASVLPSIRLIEECYRQATRLAMPWVCAPSPAGGGAREPSGPWGLGGRKVLITGASGFIGARLAERLYLEHGARPRCLVRNYNKLARLSRLPVEIVLGDVLDYEAVRRATAGCEVVVHCAYGNGPDDGLNGRINIEGTAHVARAALENGVRRLVHLSTTEVYGSAPPELVDETTEPTPTNNSYARSKLAAERLCLDYFREKALPVVILRLALVYGPHSPIATVDVVNRLLNSGFCASDAFDGLCNPVYVDDCVNAIFLAMTGADAVGETFIISGGETLTWNAYYEKHNRLLGLPPLARASRWQLLGYWVVRRAFDLAFRRLQPRYGNDMFFAYSRLRERREIPNVKAFLQKGSLLDAAEVYGRRTYYSIDKARARLGYAPKYTLDGGLALVRQWLAC